MDDTPVDLRALIGTIRRQYRLILLVLAATLAVALLVVFGLRPTYTATALVLVDPSHKDLLATTAPVDSSISDSARVDSEVELVKSQRTLLAVIQQLDLVHNPEFGPRLGVLDKVRMAIHLGQPSLPSGEQALGVVTGQLDAAVSVQRHGTTFLLQINAQTGDPALSAKLANAVATTYIADQRQTKTDSVLASRDTIQSRLSAANASVVDSEEAIDAFILSNFNAFAQGSTKDQLVGIRDRLQAVENDESAKSGKADSIAKALDGADWAQLTALAATDAATTLGQRHGDLQKQIAALTPGTDGSGLRAQLADVEAQLRQLARAEIASLRSDVAADKAQGTDLKSQLRNAAVAGDLPPALLTNLYELQQSAQVARSQYQSLIAREKDLETEAYLQVADSRLASEATPPSSPSFPNTRLILSLAGLAGLALGFGAAMLRENLIGGFVSLTQVHAVLRVPAIAAVPWQRPPRSDSLKPLSVADLMTTAPLSAYAESIRMAQVGVDQALRRRYKRLDEAEQGLGALVMVSSAEPGEGKTTISLSLARAFAASGRSTLLIDGDLRLPRLHQHLQMEPSAGLMNYLSGAGNGTRLDEIIVADRALDLRVIVGAGRSEAPTNQFVTNRSLNNLLSAARRHFDMVIVDTPPITPAVDGLYLAEHADVVVFVLNWAHTSQLIARSAVEALQSSVPEGAEIVAVLNQQRGSTPRGGDYYGYG